MNYRNFYTVALWLPLAWPVLISIGEICLRQMMWHQMSKLSGLILLSGLFGGIQYLMFAAALSYYFSRRPIEGAKRLSWFLPLIFAPVCSLVLWMFFSMITMRASQIQVRAGEAATPFDMVSVSTDVAIFSVLAGYSYVILVHGVRLLLERWDYLRD